MKKKILKIVSCVFGLFAICGALCCSLFLEDHNKALKTNADSTISFRETDDGYIFKKKFEGMGNQHYQTNFYYFDDAEFVFTYVQSTNTISVVLNLNTVGIKLGDELRILTTSSSSSVIDFGSYVGSYYFTSFTFHIGQLYVQAPGAYRIMEFYISFEPVGSVDKSFTIINMNPPTGTTGDYYNYNYDGTGTFYVEDLKDIYSSGYDNGYTSAYDVESMPFKSLVSTGSDLYPLSMYFEDELNNVEYVPPGDYVSMCNGYYAVSIDNVSANKSITVSCKADYIKYDNEVVAIDSVDNTFIYTFSADILEGHKINLYFDTLYQVLTNRFQILIHIDIYGRSNNPEYVSHYTTTWNFSITDSFTQSPNRKPYRSNYAYVIDYYNTWDIYNIAYQEGYDYGYEVGLGESSGDYNQGYTSGYYVGFHEAESFYSSAQPTIYDNGYRAGYFDGYAKGKEDTEIVLTSDISTAYFDGYNDGYDDAYNEDATVATIFSNILLIGMLPVDFFLKILNWEFLGINIASFVSALLSVVATIIVIRIVTGKKND